VPGGTKACAGAKGESVVIFVPVGTRIFDAKTGEEVADLVENEQEVILLEGGGGGLGNIHFKSSVNRAPTKKTEGKPGERKRLRLELMVMADIGLLGYPNAGKSTFISHVSGAKPKVASYPFTTLSPKLGVVDMGFEGAYTIADIPGLIEGAADGAGLGHQFLRHVRRTKSLLHLLSLGPDEKENPIDRYLKIRKEVEKFDIELSEKREIIALSKSDLVDDDEIEIVIDLLREHVGDQPIFVFSSIKQEGLDDLRNHLWQIILGHI
jgi:GTP-binding protein